MPLSRRELLKLGLMVAPAATLTRLAEAQIGDPGSPPVVPFQRPLRIPIPVTPSGGGPPNVTLSMNEGALSILPGRPDTPIWGYVNSTNPNTPGQYPGPTIRARRNQQIVVRQLNNLPETMSVHLHGGHTGPASDGHPEDLINPGSQKDYTYPNDQLPATLWYHDHAVDQTGRHMYMGLAGMYITGDNFEDNLNLPGGVNDNVNFDVPLMITDRLFNRDGSFAYSVTDDALVRGVLGDRVMINGVIQPFFQVPARKMRFRIVNASNARIYDLRLSPAQNFIQLGSDGGLLTAPALRSTIRLGPAERADVVIDFNGMQGTQVVLRNVNRMIPQSLDRAPRDLMRFDVGNPVADSPPILPTLRTVTPLGTEARARDFALTRGVLNGRPVWFINGQLFDSNLPPQANPADGEIELWRFDNQSNVAHPMHIHLVQFQIVNINGQVPLPGSGENGWKDTVLVPGGGSAHVKALFAGTPGRYVFHCHLLEHEDHAMMAEFEVTP